MSRAAAIHDQSIAAFQEAAARAGGATIGSYRVAGHVVRIEAVGAEMTGLLRAFAHLRERPGPDPDLSLHVWDSEGSGTSIPASPWNTDDYGLYGLIEGCNDARFSTAVRSDPVALEMIDFERRSGVYWTPSARALPWWVHAAPLRPLLPDWLRRRGALPVHAGAVGLPGLGGALLAGPSGSGKSNTALACLVAGLRYAADDTCILTRASGGWSVHSIYGTAKIVPGDLARHPGLGAIARARHAEAWAPDEKQVFFIGDLAPERLSAGFPLRAVLLPRVRPGEWSALAPLTPAAAQRGMAISTMEMSPANAAATFREIAGLLREVPAFALTIGQDAARVPDLIAALLERGPSG